MADTLISGTTLIEKESRSIGDIPVGGIIEWDDTFGNLPDGFVECDGSTVNDPLSVWNGTAIPNLNTEYISIPAVEFQAKKPDVDDVEYNNTAKFIMTGSTITNFAPVIIPNGVTITSVIVYGNISDETWTFRRAGFTGTSAAMANEDLGTADTSITNPIIDNENFQYFFETSSLDTTDEIFGARITYTPRFKFIIRIR